MFSGWRWSRNEIPPALKSEMMMVRPHPGPLPPERENGHQPVGETSIVGIFPGHAKRFPLPVGEGQGEGKPTVFSRNTFVWRRPFAFLCLFAFAATILLAATTNDLSDAEIQGRRLAQQLCNARPAENITNTGVFKIRDAKKRWLEIPVRFQITAAQADSPGWEACYETTGTNHWLLTISYSANQPNHYRLVRPDGPADLTGNETAIPFAGSDFWIADFGLEFLFWPEQKILKKEFHKNCACVVLESTNPHPATNGYARVVSWIDEESGSVIEAKAYDGSDKPLKDFNLKSLAKVNGHWQVEAVIMDNDQTGSRTRLEFDNLPATNSPNTTTDSLKK